MGKYLQSRRKIFHLTYGKFDNIGINCIMLSFLPLEVEKEDLGVNTTRIPLSDQVASKDPSRSEFLSAFQKYLQAMLILSAFLISIPTAEL